MTIATALAEWIGVVSVLPPWFSFGFHILSLLFSKYFSQIGAKREGVP
jgi:hypothetical protein